jgi:glycosyltransferase involved in cell wall biosynthesis
VRLVGHAPESVLSKLSSPPEVIATGWVPRMEDELERADVLAVPIRYGGGTRIKILEGFAHRIPVVSTSQGAHGLDVEDGRHLLIADTPEGFANACAELCLDEERRRALSDHAQSLFLERYEWSTIGRTIREMARQVADS